MLIRISALEYEQNWTYFDIAPATTGHANLNAMFWYGKDVVMVAIPYWFDRLSKIKKDAGFFALDPIEQRMDKGVSSFQNARFQKGWVRFLSLASLVWAGVFFMNLLIWPILRRVNVFWGADGQLNAVGRTLGSLALFNFIWSARQEFVLGLSQGHVLLPWQLWGEYFEVKYTLWTLIVFGTLGVQMIKKPSWRFPGSTGLGFFINSVLALVGIAGVSD